MQDIYICCIFSDSSNDNHLIQTQAIINFLLRLPDDRNWNDIYHIGRNRNAILAGAVYGMLYMNLFRQDSFNSQHLLSLQASRTKGSIRNIPFQKMNYVRMIRIAISRSAAVRVFYGYTNDIYKKFAL
jgi:hypothetical protein